METGAQSLLRSAHQSQTYLSGSVRLSVSQPVACGLMPTLLVRMREAWPGIQIELVVSNTISDLLRREADIAVRMVRPTQGSLVARRGGQVGVVACARRMCLQRRGTPSTPTDLLDHELVAMTGSKTFGAVFPPWGNWSGLSSFLCAPMISWLTGRRSALAWVSGLWQLICCGKTPM